jgi:hypothetical protein
LIQQLAPNHLTNGAAWCTGEYKAFESPVGCLHLVVQSMKGALAVCQHEHTGRIHIDLGDQRIEGPSQFVDVTLHIYLAYQS